MRAPTESERPVRTPPGLRVLRAGDAIESVRTKAGAVRLLSNGHGVEVVEGSLNRGDRLNLVPAEAGSPAGAETYYLIQGRLLCQEHGTALAYEPGDCICVERLDDPVTLTAATDVRFLYVSTQPTFHQISGSLHDLMHLADEVERADGYTADHCGRLQRLSFATGRALDLPAERLRALDHGAYLHDLGKVKIPAAILQKAGPLTKREWALVKRHPTFGREMLEPTSLRHAGRIVEQHHERIDGSGYPFGLSGAEVLVEASIVAVSDTYDAMTTDRVYRRALSREVALDEIARLAGTQFPREVVRAFEDVVGTVDDEAATSR